MLKTITILLCGCVCLSEAAQQGVDVQLRSCRTEYRTHSRSTAPGLVCTLELVPPTGMFMCESANLVGIIRVKDSSGLVRLADKRSVDITPDNKAYTTFTLAQRPSGSQIEIQGELTVTVATERTAHSPVKVNMLEKMELALSQGMSLLVTPSSANTRSANQEGGKLRRAELNIACPQGVTIRRVERVWMGVDGEIYTQPVEMEEIGRASSGKVKIVLWDADQTEQLRIVTVRSPRRAKANFRFNVSLGEVIAK